MLLFSAFSSLLVQLCAQKPVILLLDDLHWMDGPSLELLAHIDLVEKQQYAMNLSGEPHYRFVGNGEREEGED